MTLNKKSKTRDTARQNVEKNVNKALQLIEDIDKSTTAQRDFAKMFALRDTLVETFHKIKVLHEFFPIFLLINNSGHNILALFNNLPYI